MEFIEIKNGDKVFPGEYLYHEPTRDLVICGSYDSKNDVLKAMYKGRLFNDTITNFKKIKLSKQEQKVKRVERGCGGCKKR